MNKCPLCETDGTFYLEDTAGNRLLVKENILVIKQRYQEYGGGMYHEYTSEYIIRNCPWCGRKLEVAE
ncbi:DUF6980 family protein [Enterococcus dispar]|uniref:DUF6980 domain-containing protein n=1 Tax=Enterococcus dispar ATCC 51266 TaxID=1139219 RepID=S0KP15_9ENTE|nr:hypothetical protein [Enterococcus dispar]EOT42765.1 hypothetical protein OMK_01126 [Enterococcus dispar ATCC 51266]EOW84784.1 hypothetical protein I569_00073 [Enterococcus dispar ATCC 51266]OJG38465.1 hypothetical protein RV01_GL002520 [Enterococcus dispar]